MDVQPATTIALATPSSLDFVVQQLRGESNSVGFLREKDVAAMIGRQTAWHINAGERSVGLMLASGGLRVEPTLRVAIVQRSWRRCGHATRAVLAWLEHVAAKSSWPYAWCRTREDNQAMNAIHRRLGARLERHDPRIGVDGHAVAVWRYAISR